MPASYGPQANPGAYIPSTNIWDVSQVYALEGISPALRELLVRMYQNLNLMSINVNLKDTGIYFPSEFVDSQGWFPNPATTSDTVINPQLRQNFRTVVNFGALPNATFTTIPHGIADITSEYSFTRIYACTTDPVNLLYKPIPYVDVNTPANNIQIDVDATNVTITTAINYSAYTICYVVLEYLKQ